MRRATAPGRAPTRTDAEEQLLDAMERHGVPIRAVPDPGKRRRLRLLKVRRAIRGVCKIMGGSRRIA